MDFEFVTVKSFESDDSLLIRLPCVHKELISSYLRWQNFRSHNPKVATKTRSEVKFSKRKIRPQKGTGRARLGTRSNPMLKGGAVAHGPKSRHPLLKMNKIARLRAKFSCLNAIKDRLYWLNSFPDSGKVKDLLAYSTKKGSTLIISFKQMNNKSWKNIVGLKVLPYHAINVRDLLKSERVILDKESLNKYQILFESKK